MRGAEQLISNMSRFTKCPRFRLTNEPFGTGFLMTTKKQSSRSKSHHVAPKCNRFSCLSAGNFYLTWAPGQTTWQPHNRPAARRVQSMGWTPASELWLSVRGGDLFINDKSGPASEAFSQAKLGSRGFGILDVG